MMEGSKTSGFAGRWAELYPWGWYDPVWILWVCLYSIVMIPKKR